MIFGFGGTAPCEFDGSCFTGMTDLGVAVIAILVAVAITIGVIMLCVWLDQAEQGKE